MIKLTSIYRNINEIQESEVYLNPMHFKSFHSEFHQDFRLQITCIYWSILGCGPTCVKESPEEIVKLIEKNNEN